MEQPNVQTLQRELQERGFQCHIMGPNSMGNDVNTFIQAFAERQMSPNAGQEVWCCFS